jgi:hypothetical protein
MSETNAAGQNIGVLGRPNKLNLGKSEKVRHGRPHIGTKCCKVSQTERNCSSVSFAVIGRPSSVPTLIEQFQLVVHTSHGFTNGLEQ